jgi:NAD(P)-dependent dehydrogenase (short-subunit alcohol dehydrogenase family)
MDLGVRDRGYLILGGSAGIGRAAAHTLAADGARVAVAGRDADRSARAAAELAEATGATVVGLVGDLTAPAAADELVAQAVEALGGLRGVAVTTGIGPRGHRDLHSASDDDWTDTFDDVLLATVRACRAAVDALVAHGGGAIVTTAAYSIRSPKPHQIPYATLKSAVATFTKDLAKGFGPQGVRANCVCPGATETEVLAGFRTAIAEQRGWPVEEALERVMADEWGMQVALGRLGRPEELGDVIAFLLSERSSYLTGATVNVDGGTDF